MKSTKPPTHTSRKTASVMHSMYSTVYAVENSTRLATSDSRLGRRADSTAQYMIITEGSMHDEQNPDEQAVQRHLHGAELSVVTYRCVSAMVLLMP